MIDGRGDVVAIGAGAEKERPGSRRDVTRGHRAERALDADFAGAQRHFEQAGQPFLSGNVGEQRVYVRDADPGQHQPSIDVVEGQIAHQPPQAMVFRYSA